MAPNSSICVSFFSDFDEDVLMTKDDCKLRNMRIDRAAMRQKQRKLAKVKERAYTTSLDDIVFESDNDDDAPCPNKDRNDLDVIDCVELKIKDALSINDLVPELLKVSKDELINGLLHLVSRVCACDRKIVKLEIFCDTILRKNVELSSSLAHAHKKFLKFHIFALYNIP